MCEYAVVDACQGNNEFIVSTAMVAPPGNTPVEMGTCGLHLGVCVEEMLRNNARMYDRASGMLRKRGVKVVRNSKE